MKSIHRSIQPWPANGLEQLGRCPLCKSAHRILLHEGLFDTIFFAAPGTWLMWQCGDCRSAYLDPRPNEATIGLAYASYYTHDESVDAPAVSRLAQLRAKLGNDYRNWRYGTKLAPSSRFGRVAALLFPPLRWPIDAAYRYLPNPRGKPLRLLDVGCGNGAFIEAARGAGWRAFGVEPDPVARKQAEKRGFEVRPMLSDWLDHRSQFDAVTLSHVIEHVHSPSRLLEMAFAVLGPGGMIFVDTPNIEAVGHRLYGRDWRGLEPPRHLVIFNQVSFMRALAEAGFDNIRLHPRTDALAFTAAQSRRIAGGIDPYADVEPDDPMPWPRRADKLRAILGPHSEFLTATATKPGLI